MTNSTLLFTPIQQLLSLKPATISALHRLDIYILRDLIFYTPYSYRLIKLDTNLSHVQVGDLIQATVTIGEIAHYRRNVTKIYAYNATGEVILTFFRPIPKFILAKLQTQNHCTISGKVSIYDGTAQITHPDFIFNTTNAQPVEAVYHLTYGLLNKQLANYISQGLEIIAKAINAAHHDTPLWQYLQKLLNLLRKLHLLELSQTSEAAIEQQMAEAIEQLAHLELYANQLSIVKLKQNTHKLTGFTYSSNHLLQRQVLQHLGFTLTNGQRQALVEIEQAQNSPTPMMRMLQGDVGCGKTLVAMLSALNVLSAQHQIAIMAPTDLLSTQHFDFFTKTLAGLEIQIDLLVGKLTAKQKRVLKERLQAGEINIIIGTHALFQEDVVFARLGLIIIDEHHRFGVQQRLKLISKQPNVDVLVMTATPIPRSLALTQFGDMPVTNITEKPQNRLPIITSILSSNKASQVMDKLKHKLALGEKIYWVCPLISQADATEEQLASKFELIDVQTRYEQLSALYPGQVAILHGKMKGDEKDQIMQDFKNGSWNILVATTVIEVGIDVANATSIVIDNAENFGLAQLHQLRGRVGRSDLQSHCLLIYNAARMSEQARSRLNIMKTSNDGFFIAQQDLILRGGGEILGTKQSGSYEFFFADLGRDAAAILFAHDSARTANIDPFTDFQIKLFNRHQHHLVKSG